MPPAACSDGGGGSNGNDDDPDPVDAVAGIVAALGRRPIVAIGETHGIAQLHEFLVRLVRDPRLRTATTTVAVEVSSSAQPAIDAYVDGRLADGSRLLHALRDGIFSETGGADPRELDLYRAVRDANRTAPPGERLRILATDAPLSWARITRPGDLAAIDRETAMARILADDVLARGRTALWIVGGSHLMPGVFPARPSAGPLDGNAPGMARGLLEQRHPHTVHEIRFHTGFGERTAELERPMAGWPVPAVVAADRGRLRAALAGGPDGGGDVLGAGGGASPDLDSSHSDTSPAALLYLGTCASLTPLVPDLTVFDDPAYRSELDRRYRLAGRGAFDPAAYVRTVRSLVGRC